MNKKVMITVSTLAIAGLLGGCNTPDVPLVNTDNTSECIQIDKKLIKVDQFITTISGMSASQAEEYIIAIPAYEITNSSVKRRMLKDADKRKKKLIAERQQIGCPATSKK